MAEDLVSLMIEAVKDLAEEEEVHIPERVDADTPLFGDDGLLDSMGLVSFVVAVEQAIEERFDASVSLADEKALSQKSSPYRTIGTLAKYANSLIQEQEADG